MRTLAPRSSSSSTQARWFRQAALCRAVCRWKLPPRASIRPGWLSSSSAQLVGVAFLRGVEDALDRAAQFGRVGHRAPRARARAVRSPRVRTPWRSDARCGHARRSGADRSRPFRRFAHRIDVAALRRREHLVAQRPIGAFALDMRLELAPAGKAVVAGDARAGRRQVFVAGSSARSVLRRCLASFFRCSRFGWAGSSRTARAGVRLAHMKDLPSSCPASAALGRKSGWRCRQIRRAEPFTRTVGHRFGRAKSSEIAAGRASDVASPSGGFLCFRLKAGPRFCGGGCDMALTLVIGNKNYSSWSMRPWMALKAAGIRLRRGRHPALHG